MPTLTIMNRSRRTTELVHGDRYNTHPLLRYDPDILDGGVQLLKLEYLEAETTRAPVPRNQEVPKSAFGELTGRSILVATSHAWFYQCHPDPHGVKIKIMREEFFPRLRKRFPHTEILIFDDWHSCPQWPRYTQEENDRFKKCMKHMNSIYCYCDVVLFVEAPLPNLDSTIFKCDLVPSEHKWLHFIDTIQYLGERENDDHNNTTQIQKNDIVIQMNNAKESLLTIESLKQKKERTTISYLKRPYGRPNRTPAEERGWLYAERITVAIRMAAAKPEMFEDVVMTNEKMLLTMIRTWTEMLRRAASIDKCKKGAILVMLHAFEAVLYRMKFTMSDDTALVRSIMHDVVNRFKNNWQEETQRQNDMDARTRDILLRWGSFSKNYMKRAELLCDDYRNEGKRTSWVLPTIVLVIAAPMISVLLFVVRLEGDGVDPSRDKDALSSSSVWVGIGQGILCSSLNSVMNLTFAKIPLGVHSVLSIFAASTVCVLLSLILRNLSIGTIVPFELVFISVFGILMCHILFGVFKFIPVKDQQTGRTKMYGLGTWLYMPSTHRFNLKARAAVRRSLQASTISLTFGLTYPILGGVFFQSSIVIQALLIPVFFMLRVTFEYVADAHISHIFGSDDMPVINFLGVLMHEICLSVMITSIKHPLVFLSLIASDILENSFCIWSLLRISKIRSSRVSPTKIDHKQGRAKKNRKALSRRTSNVIALLLTDNDIKDTGTALFIAATLLQRELVETFVPIQAGVLLSVLYRASVKSNSIVSGWSEEDWQKTMMYIGVDFCVEVVVFTATILLLRRLYPEFNTKRILIGLMRMHWVEMSMICSVLWIGNLLYQTTYTGMDMTMEFQWLKCKNEANSTWLGGYEWDC